MWDLGSHRASRAIRFLVVGVPKVMSARMESLGKEGAQRAVDTHIIHGEFHTPDPLLGLGFADREGEVAHAKARMPPLFDVERRPAKPTRQELVQLLT